MKSVKIKNVKQWLATQVWNFCEFWDISLGKYTPHIFGCMIGCTSYKKIKGDNHD